MSAPKQLSYSDSSKFAGMPPDTQQKLASELAPLLKNLGDAERTGTGNRTREGQQRGITRDIPSTIPGQPSPGYLYIDETNDFCYRASALITKIKHAGNQDPYDEEEYEQGIGSGAKNVIELHNLAVKALTHFGGLSGSLPYDRACVITSFTAIRDATQALLAWYEKYFVSA